MKSWSAYDIGTPLYDRGFHKVIEPVITEYKHYLHALKCLMSSMVDIQA